MKIHDMQENNKTIDSKSLIWQEGYFYPVFDYSLLFKKNIAAHLNENNIPSSINIDLEDLYYFTLWYCVSLLKCGFTAVLFILTNQLILPDGLRTVAAAMQKVGLQGWIANLVNYNDPENRHRLAQIENDEFITTNSDSLIKGINAYKSTENLKKIRNIFNDFPEDKSPVLLLDASTGLAEALIKSERRIKIGFIGKETGRLSLTGIQGHFNLPALNFRNGNNFEQVLIFSPRIEITQKLKISDEREKFSERQKNYREILANFFSLPHKETGRIAVDGNYNLSDPDFSAGNVCNVIINGREILKEKKY